MRDQVSIAAAAPTPELLRRAARLQILTIVWMSVEAIVALGAAWTARSPALLGFSGDSAIEHRHHRVNCGGHRYAVAGKSETESGNSSCERGVESRRNGIRCLWLFVADRFGRTVGKRHFSRSVGRRDSGLGPRPAHREGSMASRPCFATLL